MICLIAAYAHNFVIGNKGRIPWNLKEDQLHFKELTMGSVLIMGRKSFQEIFEKFGRGLPGRETIVLSKSQNYEGENYRTVVSLTDAITYAEKNFPGKDIFICGGESVYREAIALDIVEKMYITEVDLAVEGDAFFPDFDKSRYIIEKGACDSSESDENYKRPFRYLTFRR